MTKDDFAILGEALLNEFTVDGKFGSNKYNLVDLVNSNNNTLRTLYNELKELYKKYENNEDIFDDNNVNTKKINDINYKINIIKIIASYKKEKAIELENRKLELKKINNELDLINKALEKNELERIMTTNTEELIKRKEELLSKV